LAPDLFVHHFGSRTFVGIGCARGACLYWRSVSSGSLTTRTRNDGAAIVAAAAAGGLRGCHRECRSRWLSSICPTRRVGLWLGNARMRQSDGLSRRMRWPGSVFDPRVRHVTDENNGKR
jgi:hypothetical protein